MVYTSNGQQGVLKMKTVGVISKFYILNLHQSLSSLSHCQTFKVALQREEVSISTHLREIGRFLVREMFSRFSRVSNGGGGEGGVITQMVRYFSKKRAEDVRRINPKVPLPEAAAISQNLYQVIKNHGPLNISSTWSHAQEAAVDGINSKTHMKLLLKWMRGRNMLKLLCHQVGSHKKFYYTTLPEDPNSAEAKNILAMKLEAEKNPAKRNTNKKKKKKLRKTKG